AAAALVALPVLGATAASADTGSQPAGERLGRACSRLPHRIERLEKVQTRFHADARTKGSIAFLSARIERARTAGKDDVVRVLSDRLAVRKDLDGQLPDMLA